MVCSADGGEVRMDGHEASRAIRTVMQGRWMPIIALTVRPPPPLAMGW